MVRGFPRVLVERVTRPGGLLSCYLGMEHFDYSTAATATAAAATALPPPGLPLNIEQRVISCAVVGRTCTFPTLKLGLHVSDEKWEMWGVAGGGGGEDYCFDCNQENFISMFQINSPIPNHFCNWYIKFVFFFHFSFFLCLFVIQLDYFN